MNVALKKKPILFFAIIAVAMIMVGCHKKVDSWTEIQKPIVNQIEADTIELKLNVDSDAFAQYEDLSDADKVRYVSAYGYITSDFREKTGVSSFSENTKTKVSGRTVEFYFGKNKYTVRIGGARGNDYY